MGAGCSVNHKLKTFDHASSYYLHIQLTQSSYVLFKSKIRILIYNFGVKLLSFSKFSFPINIDIVSKSFA